MELVLQARRVCREVDRPLEEVESDEPEGAVVLFAVLADIASRHEAHVCHEWIARGIPGFVCASSLTENATVRDEAIEVGDL